MCDGGAMRCALSGGIVVEADLGLYARAGVKMDMDEK